MFAKNLKISLVIFAVFLFAGFLLGSSALAKTIFVGDSNSAKLLVGGDYSASYNGVYFRSSFIDSNQYNAGIFINPNSFGSSPALAIAAYGGLTFNTGSNAESDRLIINSSGNVGIGKTNPAVRLDVNGAGAFNQPVTVGTPTANSHAATKSYVDSILGSSSTHWAANGTSIYNNNSGNVGVGISAPSQKLDVSGNALVRGTTLYLMDTNHGIKSAANQGVTIFSYGVPEGIFLQQVTGNVGIGMTSPAYKLQVNGQVSGTEFVYSSDRNLKKNIEPLQDSLAKIEKLQGVSFNWKSNGQAQVGLIAQDVKQVFPELVSGTEGHMGVQYGNLVAPLIEAVKAQQKEIDSQKAEMKIMQEELKSLQQKIQELQN